VIAGKLMTNEFVVGGAFNIDVYLFKIHNIMRNFANFALGFFLLYIILKSFFSAEDAV
jgi:phage shock protein PspC (stress-responsive transcriptional regulator)